MTITNAELIVLSSAILLFGIAPSLIARMPRPRLRPREPASALPTPGADRTDRTMDAPIQTDVGTVEPASPGVPPPATLRPARDWPPRMGAPRPFRLRELRDASGMVAPMPGSTIDRSATALAQLHQCRHEMEAQALQAPLDFSAYAIAGIERAGDEARGVVLLFTELWPEGEESAAARALFPLLPGGTIDAAAVEPA